MTNSEYLLNPNDDNLNRRLEMINSLKSFLLNATKDSDEEIIKPYHLPSGEIISCIKWKNSYFITGTDIVRSLIFRFQAFGRPVTNLKKFEEGIFSDLRNLKPGVDSILEEPKSIFLELLFKNNCIRTQKKQKVFYWKSVPHDRLFLDALERDLKREKLKITPTSKAVANPAINISLDTTQQMYDEFRKIMLYELNLDNNISISTTNTKLFGQFSLFEGNPTYKQRRRRTTSTIQPIEDKVTTKLKYIHHNDNLKNFNCPLSSCGKIFKRLEHMKRHLRTHTLERPYLCELCGKRFSRSDNLAQHKKTHNKKPSTVNQCATHQNDITDSSCNSSPLLNYSLYHDQDLLLVEDLLPTSSPEDNLMDWQNKIDWSYLNNQHFLMTPTHSHPNTTASSPIISNNSSFSLSPTDVLLQH